MTSLTEWPRQADDIQHEIDCGREWWLWCSLSAAGLPSEVQCTGFDQIRGVWSKHLITKGQRIKSSWSLSQLKRGRACIQWVHCGLHKKKIQSLCGNLLCTKNKLLTIEFQNYESTKKSLLHSPLVKSIVVLNNESVKSLQPYRRVQLAYKKV